jgi:sulfur carrier protein
MPAKGREMQITLNGERCEVVASTLADALVELGYRDSLVATAVNGAFVKATSRAQTALRNGDAVEIVAPRHGG